MVFWIILDIIVGLIVVVLYLVLYSNKTFRFMDEEDEEKLSKVLDDLKLVFCLCVVSTILIGILF